MQVTVEEREGLERELHVEIPFEQVNEQISKKLEQLSKTVKLDGFRKGKVPTRVVQQKFGKSAEQEVISDMLQHTLFEALSKEKIEPAAMPVVTKVDFESGQPLKYEATFDVMPAVNFASLDSVELEKRTAEIQASDVDGMIEKLRKQHVDWSKVDRASKDEDKLTIDFEGTLDGELFDGGSAEQVSLILGAGQFLPDFETGIRGHKAGEVFDIKVNFPSEYGAANLAGKEATFKITLHEVFSPELPKVDEDFISKFNVKTGDVDKFREEIQKSMERELSAKIKNELKQKVLDTLLEKNDLELPKSLVAQEANNIKQTLRMTPEQLEELDANTQQMIDEEANKRVHLGLLVKEYVKQNELMPSRDKVMEYIQQQAQNYEKPEEVVDWYLGNKDRLREVESVVLEDQVVDALIDTMKVKEVTSTYDEIVVAKGNQ